MKVNKSLIILIASPFVAIAGLLVSLSSVSFKPSLTPAELEILGFSYDKTQIVKKQPVTVSNLISPIEIPLLKEEFPPIPLSKLAPWEPEEKMQEELKISLILINGGRKMAIINDRVVNEGDHINKGIVAKIERNRILIKDIEGKKWIKIE